MIKKPRIFLIHATHVAIPDVNESFTRLWPDAGVSNLLDDSLPVDLEQAGQIDDAFNKRFLSLAEYACQCGADGILFTCSAFSAAIDYCKSRISIPVLKPNEAMAEEACAIGGRIGLIATFNPAISSVTKDIQALAAEQGQVIVVQPFFVPDALVAARNRDMEKHNALVVQVAEHASDCDAICFAQFSMTPAAEACAAASGRPVLTTPDSAVRKLQRLLTGQSAASAKRSEPIPR